MTSRTSPSLAPRPRPAAAPPGRPRDPEPERNSLDEVLTRAAVRSDYQPVIDLDSGAVVGYEALARGPHGAFERPDVLFAAARRAGRTAELDRICRNSAITGAWAAGLAAPWTLFVNVEPAAASDAFRNAGTSEQPVASSGDGGQPIIVELTERAFTADPMELLQLVARIRARGWGIALDDLGAERESLALLPLLRPDVIKLDLRLVQQRPSADIADIVGAVGAEAERSGTAVLAEGIEDVEHLAVARSLGATHGQGWLLGRPGPLPSPLPTFSGPPMTIASRREQRWDQSPFAMGAAKIAPRTAGKDLLIELSKSMERQAIKSGEATVVLATFQDADFFTPATRRRYSRLVETNTFVGALGQDMSPAPIPGVRGGRLHPTDPLIGEWDIAVVGPHFAVTLVARDLNDGGPDSQRRFEFVLSHDRDLAIAVATVLMSRMWPEPPAFGT